MARGKPQPTHDTVPPASRATTNARSRSPTPDDKQFARLPQRRSQVRARKPAVLLCASSAIQFHRLTSHHWASPHHAYPPPTTNSPDYSTIRQTRCVSSREAPATWRKRALTSHHCALPRSPPPTNDSPDYSPSPGYKPAGKPSSANPRHSSSASRAAAHTAAALPTSDRRMDRLLGPVPVVWTRRMSQAPSCRQLPPKPDARQGISLSSKLRDRSAPDSGLAPSGLRGCLPGCDARRLSHEAAHEKRTKRPLCLAAYGRRCSS